MSKSKTKSKRRYHPNGSGGNKKRLSRQAEQRELLYTSARGKMVLFSAMPPMLMVKIEEALNNEIGEVKKPTYTVKAKGGEQQVEHTEKSLETEADKKAWAEYKAHEQAWQAEYSSRVLRAIQIECMTPVEYDGDDELAPITFDDDAEWVQRQAFYGITVPATSFERKLHWIETEFVGHNDDVLACMSIPAELAGMEEEVLATAENMFHDSVQEEIARRSSEA